MRAPDSRLIRHAQNSENKTGARDFFFETYNKLFDNLFLYPYERQAIRQTTNRKERSMGTRGILGVRIDGQDKIAYNHFDSYPEGLGVETVKRLHRALTENGVDRLRTLARGLMAIDDTSNPSPEQIAQLKPWTDTTVSNQGTQDWYCLLRKTQGDLTLFLEAQWYQDSAQFAHDGLFCEWGWIANLDDSTLEVYRGWATAAGHGRYNTPPKEGAKYWGITLIKTIPFTDIMENGGNPAFVLLNAGIMNEDAA